MDLSDIALLARPSASRVLLLVLDGLGGVPREKDGLTELEAARTPHLDRLASEASCGLHEPVGAGITPGSGPGHLALFGYDPRRYRIGRGVLEALGVGFELKSGDVAARGNFCTLDGDGRVADRRAGRIPTEEATRLSERLAQIRVEGAEIFVQPVKEHRFLLVIRPKEESGAAIADTDPGREGESPLRPRPLSEDSAPAASVAQSWVEQASRLLQTEPRANMVLLRGFSRLPDWPKFPEVFGVRSLAVAHYPMYRGVARLVGMEAEEAPRDDALVLADLLRKRIGRYDFCFLHFKGTDRAGEDGDFDRKVALIEEVDAALPRILEAGAEVVLVTGDHSTPALLRSHSWHPVPFLLWGGAGRADPATTFGERACEAGSLGLRRGCELMPLAMARAGRLGKFGA